MNPSNKIKALFDQIDSGKMESDLTKILKAIIEKPLTIEHFTSLGMRYSTVTGRLSDLCDLGLIKKHTNPWGNYSWFSYVKNESDQLKLRNEIEEEKRQSFIKKGIEKGYIQTTEFGYYFFQGK